MMRPACRRALRSSVALSLCAAALSARGGAQQPAPNNRASIRGIAMNDLRGGPLSGAYVVLVPSGKQVPTNADGTFRFDNVATGVSQRLVVMHAMLDTLGITLTSPEFTLASAEIRSMELIVPDAASIIREFCDDAAKARGPGALIGFVRDPDTGAPVDSVTLSLVYDLSPVKTVRLPVVRTARPDSTGTTSSADFRRVPTAPWSWREPAAPRAQSRSSPIPPRRSPFAHLGCRERLA